MRKISNARVQSATLGIGDHGLLTASLTLDYGGSGQSFGGYNLDTTEPQFAAKFIRGCLRAAGVERWEHLAGCTIRADQEHTRVHRIGHIIEDYWFDPEDIA